MTTESQQNLKNERDEISLAEFILKIREWWRYLLSKWVTIVLLGVLGGILGFTYAIYKQITYTATTTFVLENEKGEGLNGLAGLASLAGVDLGGDGGGVFKGDNIFDLYKSRKMLEQTLLTSVTFDGNRQLLVERYIDFKGLRAKWAQRPELRNLKFAGNTTNENSKSAAAPNRLIDSVLTTIISDLRENFLTVNKPDKRLSTIMVDVNSTDENFAKDFNDQLVRNVNSFYISTKTKKTSETVKILQMKADSVRAIMNGAIYTAVSISDATPNLNPTRQVQRVAPTQRAQISVETNKVILGELIKNLELAKMSLAKETPLIQVIDYPVFPLKKTTLGKISMTLVMAFVFSLSTCIFLVVRRAISQLLSTHLV